MSTAPLSSRLFAIASLLAAAACEGAPVAEETHSAALESPSDRAGTSLFPGVYHNAFDGGFRGTEWFQVTRLPGEHRYSIADVFGGGFEATVTSDGAITLDRGVGQGTVASNDAFVLHPQLGGTSFTFDSVRAPRTTVDFPLSITTPMIGAARLGGRYLSTTAEIDPRSGAVLGTFDEELVIAVEGTTFRITDPGGLYFQGVFESAASIGFRSIEPPPTNPRFASFEGSAINFPQNMLGQATILDDDHWSATILLQSRAPLGSQVQRVFAFTARREP